MPLHVACSVGAAPETVKRILSLNPDAVIFRTEKGSSAGALIPRECQEKQEIKQMLREARYHFDTRFVNILETRRPRLEDMILV